MQQPSALHSHVCFACADDAVFAPALFGCQVVLLAIATASVSHPHAKVCSSFLWKTWPSPFSFGLSAPLQQSYSTAPLECIAAAAAFSFSGTAAFDSCSGLQMFSKHLVNGCVYFSPLVIPPPHLYPALMPTMYYRTEMSLVFVCVNTEPCAPRRSRFGPWCH